MKTRHRVIASIGVLLLQGLWVASAPAAVRYVNQFATGANDGTDWANAYTNLQTALGAALGGDSIWVAQGSYYPASTNFNAAFTLPANVQLVGGFAGVETAASQANWRRHRTVLDGDIQRDGLMTNNTRRLVRAYFATNAVIDGFTIQNANGRRAFHLDGLNDYEGAGIHVTGVPITIRRILFANNEAAQFGGAVRTEAGGTITSCIFSNNLAAGGGGAIYSTGGNLNLDNSVFVQNRIVQTGNGGAMVFQHADLQMRHCTFVTNFATVGSFGGNISVLNMGTATIRNSIFWGRNRYGDEGNRDHGGGISVRTTAGMVTFDTVDVQDGFITPPTNLTAVNIFNTDPLFVDVPERNVRLQSTSPVIDVGLLAASLSPDLDGVPRPQGALPDLGAYEFNTLPTAEPDAVAGLTASGQRGRVELAWTNPSDADFAGVLVLRTPGSDPVAGAPANGHTYQVGEQVGNATVVYRGPGTNATAGAASMFSNTNLTPVTTYTYTVYAYDDDSNVSGGVTAQATTMAPPPALDILTDVEAYGGFKQIELEWQNESAIEEVQQVLILRREGTAPDTTPTHTQFYQVGDFIGAAEVVYSGLGSNPAPEEMTGWVNTNLPGSTTFYYHLFAVNGGPNYSPPTEVTAATLSMVNIDSLTATPGQHSASFTWNNTDDLGFRGVLALRSSSAPPNTLPANGTVYSVGQAIGNALVAYRGPGLDNAPGAASGWTETTYLNATSTYYYAFQAYDALTNYSLPVAYTNITTLEDTDPPGPVTGFQAVFSGFGTISMTWNNPTDVDFRQVVVVRKTDPNPFWAPTPGTAYTVGQIVPAGTVIYVGTGSDNTPGAANSIVDNSGIDAGVRYYYAIYAFDVMRFYSTRALADAESPPANTLFVKADAVLGADNGSSWANAYTNLQTALAVATTSNQIWVAQGTYYPTDTANRNLRFTLDKPIAIYGGFAGAESRLSQRKHHLNPTILSGDIGVKDVHTDNSLNVVVAAAGAAGGLFDGFIVERGYSTGNGSGIYLLAGAAMTVQNCWIRHNQATESGFFTYANATIRNCRFSNNHATHRGGGFQSQNSSPTLINCLFHDNTCASNGGAAAVYHQTVTFLHCTFANNSSFNSGGDSIYFSNFVTAYIQNSIFWDIGVHGGGMFVKQPGGDNWASLVDVRYSIVRGGFNPPQQGASSNIMTFDPQFEDVGARNYRLLETSQAIDAGMTLANVPDDLDNGQRPTGQGYDLGAYEYGSTFDPVTPESLMLIIR